MKRLAISEVSVVTGASYGTILLALIPLAGVTIETFSLYCKSDITTNGSFMCSPSDNKPSLLSAMSMITFSTGIGFAIGAQYNNPTACIVGMAIGGFVGTASAMHFKIEAIHP